MKNGNRIYKIISELILVSFVWLVTKNVADYLNIFGIYGGFVLSSAFSVVVFISMKMFKWFLIDELMVNILIRLVYLMLALRIGGESNNSPSVFRSVVDNKIYNRIGSAGVLCIFSIMSLLIPFLHDIWFISLCSGLAFIALADLALITWGMASHDYGANATEMEEVLDFLIKQKTKGGGPPDGYRRLFPDDVREMAVHSACAGVVVGGR